MASLMMGTDRPFLGTYRLGAAGWLLEESLRSLTGQGRYIIPVMIGLAGVKVMRERQYFVLNRHDTGLIIAYLVLLAAMHVPYVDWNPVNQGIAGQGGGAIGGILTLVLVKVFGHFGTYIVLIALGMVSLLMVTSISLVSAGSRVRQAMVTLKPRLVGGLESFLFVEEEEVEEKEEEEPSPEQPVQRRRKKKLSPAPPAKAELKSSREIAVVGPDLQPAEEEPLLPVPGDDLSPLVRVGEANSAGTAETQETEEAEEFRLPPISILRRHSKGANPNLGRDVNEKAHLLEKTLESFGVSVKVTQVSCGPSVTRFEVQPAPGVKVSRIVSLGDDIALSLAAGGVRIEAPIPGKAAVGIEVPNQEVAVVHLRETLETREFQQSASRLTVALGKDIAGRPVVADLGKMPHLLIAGATGSGKSVCINSLICSLMFKAKPTELKLMMIDPKMVELTGYNGIPHLLTPVVTDAKKAAAALKWMTTEMDNRYARFAAAGVRDMRRYNKGQRLAGRKPMPFIVVVIDELADLMMVAPGEVEDAVCRLAQKARAAGIHLVVATQRPSVDVITGLIKANVPSRIAFAVSSQIDSRTILDVGGAEKLVGRGDMLFLPVGAAKPIRLQGAFVSDREVQNIVSFLRQQSLPEYSEEINLNESPGGTRTQEDDELFPEAVKVLLDSGQASISFLQRRLRIGYARAARLIDMMEARGMVSGQDGSKARNILINAEDYHKIFNKG